MKPKRKHTKPNGLKGKGKAHQWMLDHAGYPHDYCLIWPFSKGRGYGYFQHLSQKFMAHRFMCELANGPAPTPEHQAAHSCGRGADACVNPKHLSWKTPSENQLDKRIHGTVWRQETRTKLTPIQVLEIRGLKGRKTQDELAEMFGVGRQNIGAILTGKSWTKLQSP